MQSGGGIAKSFTVIVSTFNAPRSLHNALVGFAEQLHSDFELVIADDGSTSETSEMIKSFAQQAPFPIAHCWHEDRGFRKTAILNRAIETARGEYLIFSDGDCIPRNDFVQTHAVNARPFRFLSGGVEYLSKAATDDITDDLIAKQVLFDPLWLSRNREKPRFFGKVNSSAILQGLARRFSPTMPTFNGHNTSAWKRHLVSVNGFDERMAYGGLDRELGERLVNIGLRGKSVRHEAILVHQWHDRPYATQSSWQANNCIRREVNAKRLCWTDWGMIRGLTANGVAVAGPPALVTRLERPK